MKQSNRLAAIVFTDIVGYTALMQKDRAKAIKIVKLHESAVNDLVATHNGEVINYYGDGSLSLFQTATSAVQCAYEIQVTLKNKVPIRIGIHDGEVTLDQGKAYGDGINIASRIESSGHEGTILFSKSIKDKIKNLPFDFKTLGNFRFKNVEKQYSLYALKSNNLAPIKFYKLSNRINLLKNKNGLLIIFAALIIILTATWYLGVNKWSNASSIINQSIAVLPFQNRIGEDSEYFTIGITEDILSKVSNISGLKVLSRNILFNYDGQHKRPKEIRKDLKVGYLLGGSISTKDGMLRVTCHLVDTKDEIEIWAQTFNKKEEYVFEILNEITSTISDRLKMQFSPAGKSQIDIPPTTNLAAYNLFLRARSEYYNYDQEANNRAIDYYKKSLVLDPQFYRAMAGLSDAYSQAVYSYGTFATEYLDTAVTLSQFALDINPLSPEAWKSLAFAYDIKEEYTIAKKYYQKVLEIAPNYSDAMINLGSIYDVEGELVEAIKLYKKSISINPVHPNSYINMGNTLRKLEYYNEAESYVQEAQTFNPDNWYCYYILASIKMSQARENEAWDYILEMLNIDTSSYFLLGIAGELSRYLDINRSLEFFDEAQQIAGTSEFDDMHKKLQFLEGGDQQTHDSLKCSIQIMLDNLLDKSKFESFNKDMYKEVAYIYSLFGDLDQSIHWLNKAMQAGYLDWKLLPLDPFFYPLKNHQEFHELIDEIKSKVKMMRNEVIELRLI